MRRLRSALRGSLAPCVALLAFALAGLPVVPWVGTLATASAGVPAAGGGTGSGEAVAPPQLLALPLGIEAPAERTADASDRRLDAGHAAFANAGAPGAPTPRGIALVAPDAGVPFVVSGAARCRLHGVYRL